MDSLSSSLNTSVSLDPYKTTEPSSVGTVRQITPKTGYTTPVPEQVETVNPEPASFVEGLGAGFRGTLAYRLWEAIDPRLYTPQAGYNPEQRYRNDVQSYGYQFAPDEQKYLLKANSDDDYTYRMQIIQEKRKDAQISSEAPWGAFIGSVPDVDWAIGGPIGKVGSSVVKGGRIAERVAAAATAGAATAAVSTTAAQVLPMSEKDILIDTMAGTLGGMFDGVKSAPKFDRFKKLPDAGNLEEIEKVTPGITQHLSVHDKLAQYADKELANKLVANPMDDIGESAVTYSMSAKRAGDRMLAMVDEAIDKVTGGRFVWTPGKRAQQRVLRQDLEKQAVQWLNTARRNEYIGLEIVPHQNPAVRAITDAYVESGYAKEMLARMKEAGVHGAEDIAESAYYVPVRHSYDKMEHLVNLGKATWRGIYRMYGAQLSRMFPNLAEEIGLTPTQLGKHFVNTQKARVSDVGGQTFRGMTRDEIANTLLAAGVDKQKVNTLLDNMYSRSVDASKPNNLRRRLDWDFESQHIDAKGNVYSLNDFMDTDMTGILQSYNRNMSGRIGLAHMGFKNEAELDAAFNKALEARPSGVTRKEALAFFDNVKSSLLGRPTGEHIPDLLKSINTVASSMLLVNSGVWNLVDYANVVKEYSVGTAAKSFLKSFKHTLKFDTMSIKEAETLSDIISGKLYAEGRFRSVITHLEDNFEPALGGVHEAINHAGQSVRFLNMSEFIRRQQVLMVAGILDDLTTKFAKGDAKATQYFKSLNIDDAFGKQIKENTLKYGTVLERWPHDVRVRFETVMESATDNTATMIRNGEQPAYFQFSQVGKTLMPYMAFTWSSTNKLARRGYNRDGALGLAHMMIAQAPLAVMAGAASNIINGKPWDRDIEVKALRAIPMLGGLSVPLDAIMQGDFKGGATAGVPFASTLKLATKAANGNLTAMDIVKGTPLASVFVPARYIASLWDEANPTKKGSNDSIAQALRKQHQQ